MSGAGELGNPLVMDDAVHGPNRPVVAKALVSAPPAASVHVLLVDDERLTRTVVANLLHKCGYRGEHRAGCGWYGCGWLLTLPRGLFPCLFGPAAGPASCRAICQLQGLQAGFRGCYVAQAATGGHVWWRALRRAEETAVLTPASPSPCIRPACPVPAVTSASDGMEALQLLRSSAPDTFQLVLTVRACARASGTAGATCLPACLPRVAALLLSLLPCSPRLCLSRVAASGCVHA